MLHASFPQPGIDAISSPMRILPLISIIIGLFSVAPCARGESSPSEHRLINLHQMAPSDFSKLETLKEAIDFDHIDTALLDAAVFHETNRRRVDQGLSALNFKPILREAARIQARGMVRQEKVTHLHPDGDKKTMADRFDFLGIETMTFAENVAMTFGIRYQSGEPIYPRVENGKKVFSREPDGTPIQPHTYVSFATQLLDAWMASPGHRKNILLESITCLGTSSLHDRSGLGMDTFYSAQEFSADLTVRDMP